MKQLNLNDATPIAFHPYRTRYPWDHGGRRILSMEYDRDSEIRALECYLCECLGKRPDNHYTITARTESGLLVDLYFSDWRFYVFVMPDDRAPEIEGAS